MPADDPGVSDGDVSQFSLFIHCRDRKNTVIIECRSAGRHELRCRSCCKIVQIQFRREHLCQIDRDIPFLAFVFLMGRKKRLSVQFQRCCLYRAIGESGREMRIIQDPDFHIHLSGFIQNDIHVFPPLLSAEIRMRSGFDADGLAVTVMDDLHHLS